MAKIKPISIISSISGKLAKDDETYIYTNKKTGKQTTRRIGNKRGGERTPAQTANSARFASLSQQVSQWFATNGITAGNPQGTAEYQQVMAKYKAQDRYGHPNHFVRHLISTGEIQ